MSNILTAGEAANVLRCSTTDAEMLTLLPLIDRYLLNATGHDWTADSSVRDEAKAAARILLVQWYENPGRTGAEGVVERGFSAALVQLIVIALRYKTFQGRNGAGSIILPGVYVGDQIQTLTGLVGASGDQSALFEAAITVDGQIQQLSELDLSGKWYRAYVLSPEEL